MREFKLHILAADRVFYEGQATSLVVPTPDGEYGVLAGHMNIISAISAGELHFTRADGRVDIAAVSNGMLKVEDNDVLILVDTAERRSEIDENRARRDADDAKEALLQKKSIQDYKSAQAKMARAVARLNVKNKERP